MIRQTKNIFPWLPADTSPAYHSPGNKASDSSGYFTGSILDIFNN
ncbi:MAG: hypothetical protein WDZ47_09045 [Bacteroidales bacterium]